jgi:hypothetical protein
MHETRLEHTARLLEREQQSGHDLAQGQAAQEVEFPAAVSPVTPMILLALPRRRRDVHDVAEVAAEERGPRIVPLVDTLLDIPMPGPDVEAEFAGWGYGMTVKVRKAGREVCRVCGLQKQNEDAVRVRSDRSSTFGEGGRAVQR